MTDDLLISRSACLEVGLRLRERRERVGPTRFGLGDIGPRHLADVEAVFGLLECLGEHFDIVLAQANGGGIANNVHIGSDAVEQR